MAITIVLADDHPMTRAGLAFRFSQQDEFILLGEAEDGNKAWTLVNESKPDVVLMDIEMPGENGIAVTQRIKEKQMDTHVLMLTSYKAQPYVIASLKAGASGFILKTAPLDELEKAIKTVHRGAFYIDPKIAHFSVLEKAVLTQREREVLILTAQGLSGKDSAQILGISERTVEAHLSAAYGKLGVRNKTEAILMALKDGIILLDELSINKGELHL